MNSCVVHEFELDVDHTVYFLYGKCVDISLKDTVIVLHCMTTVYNTYIIIIIMIAIDHIYYWKAFSRATKYMQIGQSKHKL